MKHRASARQRRGRRSHRPRPTPPTRWTAWNGRLNIKTRCCSDYDALCYSTIGNSGVNAECYAEYSSSDSDQGAGHQWAQAKAACEADVSAGVDKPRRLCTVAELETRMCSGTGCTFDSHPIWTSDVCNISPSSPPKPPSPPPSPHPPPPESPKPPPAPPLDEECDEYECVWCGSGTYDEAQAACDDPAVFDSCPMLAVETPNSLELPLPPPAPLAPGQVPAWTITLEVVVLTTAITDDGTIPEGAMLTAVTNVVRTVKPEAVVEFTSSAASRRRAMEAHRRQLETLVIDCGSSCNDGGACVPGAMTTLTYTITLFEEELTAAELEQIRSTIETAVLTLKLATGGDSLCSVGGEGADFEPDYLPPPPPCHPAAVPPGTVKSQSIHHVRPADVMSEAVLDAFADWVADGANRESLGFYATASDVQHHGTPVRRQLWLRLQRVPVRNHPDQHLLRDRRGQPVGVQLERGLPRGVQRPAVHAAERAAARLHDGPVPGPGRQRELETCSGDNRILTIQELTSRPGRWSQPTRPRGAGGSGIYTDPLSGQYNDINVPARWTAHGCNFRTYQTTAYVGYDRCDHRARQI